MSTSSETTDKPSTTVKADSTEDTIKAVEPPASDSTEDTIKPASDSTDDTIKPASDSTDDTIKPASDAPSSTGPLEEKILRQIEYYFGDRNLPRDKFLQQAAASGEGGYVPIATLLTFNRLKALSSNEELIANVVRQSGSTLVQVSSDGGCVRRYPDKPLPDIFSPDLRKVIKCKTVYVKGFPENVTLDQLQTFFEGFGKVEHIQMRRFGADDGRKFKGSVFVEFGSKSIADSFLATQNVQFHSSDLTKESKEGYFQRKNSDRKEKKSVGTELSESKEQVVKSKDCVLHFKGCGASPTWESIKEAFSEYATVAFVDFSDDDRTEGFVRFKEEGGAIKAVEGLSSNADQPPQLLGVDTVVRVLEGSEEIKYWTKLEDKKRMKMSGSKGRGGYKRKARRDERPRPFKQLKTED
ncbi:la protein homolog [Halichondria panicea]|uniref:la protein homolog n=1 Tax=Halichondria panicea TaxID=6063 RepID=UPI00312B6624